MTLARLSTLLLLTSCFSGLSWAGSIFLTGHDPDFHAFVGGNAAGAQAINQAAINFITDPGFNPYTATDHKFLFVESSISPPSGHVDGVNGIIDSGYTLGTDFDRVDASGLNAALDSLGSTYDAIVIASDFGGILTQAELNILDARSADIITFLNSGGGLYAMAEGNNGAGLTPDGGWFGFLPFIVTAADLNQGESGFTVTPFGASLGLTASDINGNASHNIFTSTGGMSIVDQDPNGDILSLATRSTVTVGGVAPEPSTMLLFGSGSLSLLFLIRRRRQ
jgi:hypothetical protein